MADHLTYFINDQLLVGDINGVHFQERAVSGGRAGRKDPTTNKTLPPVDSNLANNVWRTDKAGIVDTNVLGGPLPCGQYTVTANAHKHLWLDLKGDGFIPLVNSGHRGGFAIHGRGKWGSYGCIVLLDGARLHLLYNTVRSASQVSLNVIAGTIQDLA